MHCLYVSLSVISVQRVNFYYDDYVCRAMSNMSICSHLRLSKVAVTCSIVHILCSSLLMAEVFVVEYYKFCRRRSSVQLFDKVVVIKVR